MPTHALRPVAPQSILTSEAVVATPAPASTTSLRQKPLARVFALLTIVAAIAGLGACGTGNSAGKGAQIASLARTHLGAPYVYGGAGPYSFDCSGLTQYVYRQAGIAIPRTTWDQLAQARRVAPGQGQPGDIVFIGNYHVGIYMGGGQMIDAPKTGDVVRQRAIWTGYSLGRFY